VRGRDVLEALQLLLHLVDAARDGGQRRKALVKGDAARVFEVTVPDVDGDVLGRMDGQYGERTPRARGYERGGLWRQHRARMSGAGSPAQFLQSEGSSADACQPNAKQCYSRARIRTPAGCC
jgi:hypothetical protein